MEAILFDAEGVIVEQPLAHAYGEALCELMENDWAPLWEETTYDASAYSSEVYEKQLRGLSRREGAHRLMEMFRIPEDEEGSRVRELSARKYRVLLRLIDEGRFKVHEDALAFITRAKELGWTLGATHPTQLTRQMAEQVQVQIEGESLGLGGIFGDTLVAETDGEEAVMASDRWEIAAALLGVPLAQCAVISADPVSLSLARGKAAYLIGVDRFDRAAELEAAGAEDVVTSLKQITLDRDELRIHD